MSRVLFRPKRSSRRLSGSTGPRRSFFPRQIPFTLVFGAGIVAALFGGAWYVFAGSDMFALRQIRVEGSEHVAKSELEGTARSLLAHKRFGILPQNFLFVRTEALSQGILADFPRIATVRVLKNIRPFSLTVRVEERELFAFWCEGRALDEHPIASLGYSLGQCFIVDKNGVVFDSAPPSQGALVLTLVEFRESKPSLGEAVADAGVLGELEKLRLSVKSEAGVNIVRIVSVNTRELRGETAEGWVMLFDPSEDLTAQIKALRETLVQKLTPDKRRGLSYIDLRTPGRVFYK